MATNLPTKLDYGLVDLDNYQASLTAIKVRQVRSRLEGVELPCGFPGCSYCDPDAEDTKTPVQHQRAENA